jgi:RNA recognition motif-containing protein
MSKSLFVGNIAYGAMEREIRELFSTCGTVEDVRFVMDYQKGRFRGFGFVHMPDGDAEEAVQKLNGEEFQGRNLKVSVAQPSNRQTGKQTNHLSVSFS